ncbi:hypothetical protein ABTX82_39160 [Streptomyces lavendulae]|uniref:hypothetical protein n=1 Tax=Streptomyces lavendulae TaxID=1914 RepID=UPI003325C94F
MAQLDAGTSREHSDRRIVTLRGGPHIQERADEFFGPLAGRLDATMSPYPPQLLEKSEQFMTDLNATMDAHLAERSPEAPCPPGVPAAASDSQAPRGRSFPLSCRRP